MKRGPQNRQSTHNQRTTQTTMAMKPSSLNNDVLTRTKTSSDTRTANYTKSHRRKAKGNYQHEKEDTYVRGQSLST